MRFYKPNKGVTLPTLTKPAGPADIVLDKEAINEKGMKITGTLEATGGEPSYTLQIMGAGDNDYIVYYEPGSSEKTMLTLTSSFQNFTSGSFICLNRRTNGNITSNISFNDSNGTLLLNVSISTNHKYVVNANTIGWSTINIGALKRDFPSMAQIVVTSMD